MYYPVKKGLVKRKCKAIFQKNSYGIWNIKIYQLVRHFLQWKRWQDRMDDILSRTDLSNDEKAKQYFQLQDRYLSFKQQMNTPTVRHPDSIEREEINITFPEQISKQDSSTSKASTTPLNPFNTTPKLNQPSILPKPTTLSSTPLVSNPSILTPPPTIETPSQGPKRKRRCIRFVKYLDDKVSQKQRKQTRRQRYRAGIKMRTDRLFSFEIQLFILLFLYSIYHQGQ